MLLADIAFAAQVGVWGDGTGWDVWRRRGDSAVVCNSPPFPYSYR